MKRLGTIIFLLLVTALLMMSLFGCSQDKTAVGIEVVTAPQKIEYIEGETVAFDGLIVKIKYDDDSYSEAIDVSSLTLPAVDTSTSGTKTVTVKYIIDGTEYETNFSITVNEPHVHSYANEWISDVTHHWHAATCEHSAERSGYATHTYDNACDTNCNVCGATRTTTHVYDNACDTACNVCGTTRTITHDYAEAWTTDSTQHWHVCTVCGDIQDEKANHTYDNACDTNCNVCGATRTTEHAYDNACDTTCNVCGATRTITHDYAEAWTTDSTQHWHVCTVCGDIQDEKENHAYDNACDTNCNVCGATRTTEHAYDNACDTTCNVCGATRTITHDYAEQWSKDGEYHWHECTVCNAQKDKAEHIWVDGSIISSPTETTEGSKSVSCKCGATAVQTIPVLTHVHNYGQDWSHNDTNHWHECTCGDKKDNAVHTYDNACDTDCNICGTTRTINHDYAEAWTTDSTQHWHVCIVCGDIQDEKENHTYDNACDTNCNVCGATRTTVTPTAAITL